MLTFSADDVDRALTFPGLVETLRGAFRDGAVQPARPAERKRDEAKRRLVRMALDFIRVENSVQMPNGTK